MPLCTKYPRTLTFENFLMLHLYKKKIQAHLLGSWRLEVVPSFAPSFARPPDRPHLRPPRCRKPAGFAHPCLRWWWWWWRRRNRRRPPLSARPCALMVSHSRHARGFCNGLPGFLKHLAHILPNECPGLLTR